MIRFLKETVGGHFGWVGRGDVSREGEVLGGGGTSDSSQFLEVVEEDDVA